MNMEIDENGQWSSQSDALAWYRAELKSEREKRERLQAALIDLLQQIESCDGTAQLYIDDAVNTLKFFEKINTRRKP